VARVTRTRPVGLDAWSVGSGAGQADVQRRSRSGAPSVGPQSGWWSRHRCHARGRAVGLWMGCASGQPQARDELNVSCACLLGALWCLARATAGCPRSCGRAQQTASQRPTPVTIGREARPISLSSRPSRRRASGIDGATSAVAPYESTSLVTHSGTTSTATRGQWRSSVLAHQSARSSNPAMLGDSCGIPPTSSARTWIEQ